MPDLLLAIETATTTARVALLEDDGAVVAAAEKTAARHSSNLLGLVDEVLGAANVRLADLCAIACGAGPGSFTGLRVGLAVAKGLALPTDLPLLLVSSLEALAHDIDASTGSLLVPCLDAGKDQVYARLFRAAAGGAIAAVDDEWVLDPAALVARLEGAGGPVVAAGTGVDRYLALFRERLGDAAIRPAIAGPTAAAVGRLALRRFARGEMDDLAAAVPSYGRPPDITQPKTRP